jgi:hypothetical protein
MGHSGEAPRSSNTAHVIYGQYHKFELIPIIEHHTQWFEAGPVTLAVEARALGDSRTRMVRGPSIHVFSADRSTEYLRFDLFGKDQHYHYILDDIKHNVVWGYDVDANGPMLDWIIQSLRHRLPAMLRKANGGTLADAIERSGWNQSVLPDVEKAARDADREREDDLERAKEGMDWMRRWKQLHPEFNTVD